MLIVSGTHLFVTNRESETPLCTVATWQFINYHIKIRTKHLNLQIINNNSNIKHLHIIKVLGEELTWYRGF